jgi:hypothetical protein
MRLLAVIATAANKGLRNPVIASGIATALYENAHARFC